MNGLLRVLGAFVAIVLAVSRAGAQEGRAIPQLGYLSVVAADSREPHTAAFRAALRDLGYVDGVNIAITSRWAAYKLDRLPALARELVALNVSIIVALEPPAALAARAATTSIPIIMRATQDPVALGLADSLGHPGRNVTGVTSISPDLHGKRFELLREVMGRQRQIAVLWNPKVEIRQVQLADMRHAGEALGLRTAFVEVTNADEVKAAFASDALKRAGGLTVIRDPLIVSHRAEIAGLAIAAHLPSVFDERDYALAGGLMSYGANVGELYRRAAGYVDKVLRGARPGDLPIEQPTKFELVVNLKTARALGITLPPPILARADEVIE